MKKKVILVSAIILVLLVSVTTIAVCMEMQRKNDVDSDLYYFDKTVTAEKLYFVRQDAVRSVNNEQGILTYEKSITRADGEVVDYYLDKDGNRYSYNAAGELVGTKPANENVTENKASTQSKRLNEEQLIAMAKKFAAETFGKEYVDLLNETTLTHLKSKDRYVVTLSYVYDGISIERCDVTLKPDGTLYNVGTINKGKYDGIDIKKLADVDMETYVSEQLGGKEKAPKHEINTIWLGKNAEGKQCLIADVTVWEYSEIFGEVRDKYREFYYILE